MQPAPNRSTPIHGSSILKSENRNISQYFMLTGDFFRHQIPYPLNYRYNAHEYNHPVKLYSIFKNRHIHYLR